MKKVLIYISLALIASACSSVNLSPTDRYDKTYAFKNLENAELYLK